MNVIGISLNALFLKGMLEKSKRILYPPRGHVFEFCLSLIDLSERIKCYLANGKSIALFQNLKLLF